MTHRIIQSASAACTTALLVGAFLFTGCNTLPLGSSSESSGPETSPLKNQASLKITMHDTTGPYDAVLIDIVDAMANVSDTANSGWVPLAINAGIYDLLVLQNGIDTLLVNPTPLPAGYISQVRLILGTENSVVIDSDTLALTTPSAQQTGVKINVQDSLEANTAYDLILDFDAEQSVVKAGNSGKYLLKPVIQVDSLVEI